MKICGISDIHGNLYNKIPICDVLCICGDIVPLSIQRDLSKSEKWFTNNFLTWISNLSCKKVLVVPGNHDFYLYELYKNDNWDYFYESSYHKLEILIDEEYDYNGIKFYGTPWINPIPFQEGRWAFELPPAKIDEHLYNKIPKCEVLLTHDNPNYNHVLDYYISGKANYHLFGHWHDGSARTAWGEYNCSILDDTYNFKKNLEIVTIEIDDMTSFNKKYIETNFLTNLIKRYKSENCLPEDTNELQYIETNEATVLDFLNNQFYYIENSVEDNVEWDVSGSFCSDYSEEDDTPKLSFEEELEVNEV